MVLSVAKRVAANAAIALVSVVLFHLLSMSSGKVDANRGLGWDGRAYAELASVSLTEGNSLTRARPLIVLPAAALHRWGGVDVVRSFLIFNYVYAWALALAICALLDLYAVPWPAKLTVVGNVSLCIATSKMYGFYPVQVDFGAMALITWTFYLATAQRHGAASATGVFAALSREFAVAVLLYGMVAAWRSGRRWWQAAAVYLPAFLAFAGVREWARIIGPAKDDQHVTVAAALANLHLWQSPTYGLIFSYLALTVFGGLGFVLLSRPVWLVRQLIARWELLVFLLPIVVAAVAGKVDVWRYLVFMLPAIVALIGSYAQKVDAAQLRTLMIVATLMTIVSQRPFEQLNVDSYYRDWFPLYEHPDRLGLAWSSRIIATLLFWGGLTLVTSHGFSRSGKPTSNS